MRDRGREEKGVRRWGGRWGGAFGFSSDFDDVDGWHRRVKLQTDHTRDRKTSV